MSCYVWNSVMQCSAHVRMSLATASASRVAWRHVEDTEVGLAYGAESTVVSKRVLALGGVCVPSGEYMDPTRRMLEEDPLLRSYLVRQLTLHGIASVPQLLQWWLRCDEDSLPLSLEFISREDDISLPVDNSDEPFVGVTVVDWDCESTRFNIAENLAALVNVRGLFLLTSAGNTPFSELSAIGRLPSLQFLFLSGVEHDHSADNWASNAVNLWGAVFNTSEYLALDLKVIRAPYLRVLVLEECDNIEDLEPVVACVLLKTLVVSKCWAVDRYPAFAALHKLRTLSVSGAVFNSLRLLDGCNMLVSLTLQQCSEELAALDELSACVPFLETLSVESCSFLKVITEALTLKWLQVLTLRWCDDITAGDARGCMALRELEITHCGHLDRVTGLSPLRKLTRIIVSHCDRLTDG